MAVDLGGSSLLAVSAAGASLAGAVDSLGVVVGAAVGTSGAAGVSAAGGGVAGSVGAAGVLGASVCAGGVAAVVSVGAGATGGVSSFLCFLKNPNIIVSFLCTNLVLMLTPFSVSSNTDLKKQG
jgi:hypothetical protein